MISEQKDKIVNCSWNNSLNWAYRSKRNYKAVDVSLPYKVLRRLKNTLPQSSARCFGHLLLTSHGIVKVFVFCRRFKIMIMKMGK
jgi:hypothetical protein